MSVSETITHGFTIGAASITKPVAITGSRRSELDESVAIGSNTLVPFTAVAANIKALVISSDQDLTIKTNSSGSPQETLSVKAGKPWVWHTNCGFALPFGGDVTALYITNASSAAANFQLVCIE